MTQQLLAEVEKGSKNALIKKRIITHFIHNGNSTITDLSKEMDMSVPTVTKFIDEMCEAGFLDIYGKLETSGGRHPNLYGLNSESGYFIGVEVKQSSVNIGLINFTGNLIEKKMDVSYHFENSQEGLNLLCQIILNFIKKLNVPKDKIINININLSGRVNPESGYSYSYFNFGERPLVELVSEKIGYKVSIENDTRAMTYGEYLKGNVNGEKNIIFVNISWGLGIGIIIDGKIYKGKSGFAGEFGHFPAYDNEIICHCGKKGCLETETAGSALCRKLFDRINKGEGSILSGKMNGGKSDIDIEDIINAVNQEDILCIEVVEEIGSELGKYIAGLINIFNPELVIIGGLLSRTGDYITQPIKTAVRKHSLNLVSKDSVIQTSKLGDTAGIVGSCMIARGKVFED